MQSAFATSEIAAWRSVFDRLYSYLLIELCDPDHCTPVSAVLSRFVCDPNSALQSHVCQALFGATQSQTGAASASASGAAGKGVVLHRVLQLIYQGTNS